LIHSLVTCLRSRTDARWCKEDLRVIYFTPGVYEGIVSHQGYLPIYAQYSRMQGAEYEAVALFIKSGRIVPYTLAYRIDTQSYLIAPYKAIFQINYMVSW
jgi:hypothetical protein